MYISFIIGKLNMIRHILILLIFIYCGWVCAQERITTSSRWTDLGQHASGIQMYVSFNMLGKEISLDSNDSTIIQNQATTRCRYRLSNFSDKDVLLLQIKITLYSGEEQFDVLEKEKSVVIKPWANHYGAFLTPKLRNAQKVVESASISIHAKPKE
jgi:hypothetical protein